MFSAEISVMMICTSGAGDAAFRAKAEGLAIENAYLRDHTILVDDDGNPCRRPSQSFFVRSRLPEGHALGDHIEDVLRRLRAGDAETQGKFFQTYHPTLSVRIVAPNGGVPSISLSRSEMNYLAELYCDLDIDVALG